MITISLAGLLIGIAVLGLAGLLIYLTYHVVKSINESAQRTCEAAERLAVVMGGLRETFGSMVLNCSTAVNQLRDTVGPAAAELQTNMAAVPKLLEAVARVGQAQLEIMQAQRAAGQAKHDNPFGRPNGSMPPKDIEAANLEYEVGEIMRSQGVSREQALMQLNPANIGSVWDGGGVLDGWMR